MGRSKVAMESINNVKKRNLTFRTRKKGIIKKALELTTLCDVNVSMIICSSDHDQEPLIFPPDHQRFTSMTDLYRRNRIMKPEKIRCYSLSDFFQEKTTKVEEEVAETKKRNLEAKYPSWFDFMERYSEVELREFALKLGSKIGDVKNKVESSLRNISKIIPNQPQDHYPTTTVSSINPCCPTDFDDLLSFDPTELFGDDCGYHDDEKLVLHPPPFVYCFTPEGLPQREPPACIHHQNNFIVMESSNPDSVQILSENDIDCLTDNDKYFSFHHPPPACTSFQPHHPAVLPPLISDDQNNLIMQSSKPADSLMNPLMAEDDNDYCDHDTYSLQRCFSPEMVQQPPCSDLNNFITHASQPYSMIKHPISKDDIDCVNLSFEPAYCFQPETPPDPVLHATI